METVTFILPKPSKPSLYLFLRLLLDLEARSSYLGVLSFLFLNTIFLGLARLRERCCPNLLCFTLWGGLGAHSLDSCWMEARPAANECAVPGTRLELVWSNSPTNSVGSQHRLLLSPNPFLFCRTSC